MMSPLRNAWRWMKRELLLADITSYENQLLAMTADELRTERAAELRGLLSLAYARLESEEFA